MTIEGKRNAGRQKGKKEMKTIINWDKMSAAEAEEYRGIQRVIDELDGVMAKATEYNITLGHPLRGKKEITKTVSVDEIRDYLKKRHDVWIEEKARLERRMVSEGKAWEEKTDTDTDEV